MNADPFIVDKNLTITETRQPGAGTTITLELNLMADVRRGANTLIPDEDVRGEIRDSIIQTGVDRLLTRLYGSVRQDGYRLSVLIPKMFTGMGEDRFLVTEEVNEILLRLQHAGEEVPE